MPRPLAVLILMLALTASAQVPAVAQGNSQKGDKRDDSRRDDDRRDGDRRDGDRRDDDRRDDDKEKICHKDDNRSQRTITVSRSAIPAHMRHHDWMGACAASPKR